MSLIWVIFQLIHFQVLTIFQSYNFVVYKRLMPVVCRGVCERCLYSFERGSRSKESRYWIKMHNKLIRSYFGELFLWFNINFVEGHNCWNNCLKVEPLITSLVCTLHFMCGVRYFRFILRYENINIDSSFEINVHLLISVILILHYLK